MLINNFDISPSFPSYPKGFLYVYIYQTNIDSRKGILGYDLGYMPLHLI